ncbi:dienelactone hydrolase family protein [Hydrogenobacter thermophilus]|uniref:dienelactone hydrolase family protein n=1 Tax=Hydrogenobacter thermophilus TaxID=940 RepID=UPI0030F75AE4
MGRELKFKKDGVEISGYLAEPEFTKGPLVIVIHEWWGLVPHIKDVCDRYAREGFFAFGIDLYKGKTADNPDDAGRLMQELMGQRLSEAEAMIKASLDYFKENDIGFVGRVQDYRIGMTGFCCGGTCTWYFGAKFSDEFSALAPYYGLYSLVPIDFSAIKAPVLAVHAGKDAFVPLSEVLKAIEECNKYGVKAQFLIYSGVDHAFFNDTRPEVYNEEYAVDVWGKTVEFMKRHLT